VALQGTHADTNWQGWKRGRGRGRGLSPNARPEGKCRMVLCHVRSSTSGQLLGARHAPTSLDHSCMMNLLLLAKKPSSFSSSSSFLCRPPGRAAGGCPHPRQQPIPPCEHACMSGVRHAPSSRAFLSHARAASSSLCHSQESLMNVLRTLHLSWRAPGAPARLVAACAGDLACRNDS